ncbi:MAG: hypothetical protein JKX76_05945 [Colwellia sp.]|nr:hypothetical protein [Colwellia sp.]
MNQGEFKSYVSKTYDFSPYALSKTEIEKKSKILDAFWSDAKNRKSETLPVLRKELEGNYHKPFFYYNGASLLLSLSESVADKELFLRSIVKADLKDLQHTDYLYQVQKLAVEGYDTSAAAFHILNYPNFKTFIPQHVLTLGQDFSLIYMLFPTDESFYLEKLISRLQVETNEVAIKSLLLCIWYTVTENGNLAIASFIKRSHENPDLIKYAQSLLARNKKVSRSGNVSSYKAIKNQRNKALGRISDEALHELNSYTKDLIGKLH